MSDQQDLTQKLERIEGADFTDPNFYADLLGYNEAPAAPAVQPQGETAAPAPATQPAPAAADSTQPPASAEPAPEQIAGALTRDGKHVIPYQVVQDLRTANTAKDQRIAELQAAMERMQQEQQAKDNGTSTDASQAQAQAAALDFSEDELADYEALGVGKLVKGYQALRAQLLAPPVAPAVAPPQQPAAEVDKSPLQAAIDTMPLLVRWQAKGGAIWSEAVKVDNELRADPQWAGKPMHERFAEVQRRVADDYGIPIPSAPSAPPAAAQPSRPTTSSEAREVMPSITDFAGGPVAVGDPMQGMSRGQMVDAMMNLSMEDIRKSVGLSY